MVGTGESVAVRRPCFCLAPAEGGPVLADLPYLKKKPELLVLKVKSLPTFKYWQIIILETRRTKQNTSVAPSS